MRRQQHLQFRLFERRQRLAQLCQHLYLHRDQPARRDPHLHHRLRHQRAELDPGQRRQHAADQHRPHQRHRRQDACRSAASSPAAPRRITSNTRTIRTTLTFAVPVRDIIINTHDIDFTINQFRDWLYVSGTDGTSTFVPVAHQPGRQQQCAGARTDGNSSVTFGVVRRALQHHLERGRRHQRPATTRTSTTGDVVDQLPAAGDLGHDPLRQFPAISRAKSSTGQQFVGISRVRFCPMPAIAIAKTSAPYITTAGSPDRFNAPGSDVAYTLTVTNSGGSPVDVSTPALTDVLPANVTFYNGDYNAGLAGHGAVRADRRDAAASPCRRRAALIRTIMARPTPTRPPRATTPMSTRCGSPRRQHGRQFELHHPVSREDQLGWPDRTGAVGAVAGVPAMPESSSSFCRPPTCAGNSRLARETRNDL